MEAELLEIFSPDGTVFAFVAEAVTADEDGAENVVSIAGAALTFVEAEESAVGGVADFAVEAAGAVGIPFVDEVAAPPLVTGVVVTVAGAVRDAVTVGGAAETEGDDSVFARFGVVFGSTGDGTAVSPSETISIIRRSGSRSVNAVARSVVARSNTTRTVPASN